MHTFVIGRGPDLAESGPSVHHVQEDNQLINVRVVDLFVLLCNLLDLNCPTHVSGDAKRINAMLRYSADTPVVKVIRSWISIAFEPQNAPVTSEYFLIISLQLSWLIFFLDFSCCRPICIGDIFLIHWPVYLLYSTLLLFNETQILSSVNRVQIYSSVSSF